MEILRIVKGYAESQGLRFLVGGGNAINSFGYGRSTGDLDLIIPDNQILGWKDLLIKLKYEAFQEGQSFCRFKAAEIASWPIDLMKVNTDTFEKLVSNAELKDFGQCTALVPSIQHIIAMKLHALKNDFEYRKSKDISDIIELMKIGELNIEMPEVQKLILKFGNQQIEQEIKKRI